VSTGILRFFHQGLKLALASPTIQAVSMMTTEANCPRCGTAISLPVLSALGEIVCPACQHRFPPSSAKSGRIEKARAAQRRGTTCLRAAGAFLAAFLLVFFWQPEIGVVLAGIGVALLLSWAFISTRSKRVQ
jgi:uncharacterized paraquat-inducible protein A